MIHFKQTREKKPRESILRAEFANAINIINKDLSQENRLRFLHWDLNKSRRSIGTTVISLLFTLYGLNCSSISMSIESRVLF